MRIFHVIGSLDPAAGGPPAVAVRLAAAQAAAGHDVSIVCYGSKEQSHTVLQSLSHVPGLHKVKIVTHSPNPGWQSRREALTGSMIKHHLRSRIVGGDMLHLHGVWEPLLLRSSKIARYAGADYVVTPHGMLDPWSLSQSRMKKKIAMALGYRGMLRSAKFLHVLNEDEAKLIEPLQLGVKLRVFPNGIFLQEIEPLPMPGGFYSAHPELKNKPYLLFLSRLHYKKGLDYLADAFAKIAPQLPDLQLVVAGPDGGEKEKFLAQISQAGLNQRVLLTGPIYGKAKYEAMVDALCFCLPSRQEGFSLAVTESLACGTPAVISNECHFPQVAQAGAGIVTQLSSDAVAAAILKIAKNPDVRNNMSLAGRKLIAENYTWEKIAQKMTEAYRKD